MSILTGRKKTQFSHLCSSVIPNPIETKHMKKFADICYTFLHGKNASWNRHVQYILIEKPLKIKLIIMYRLP